LTSCPYSLDLNRTRGNGEIAGGEKIPGNPFSSAGIAKTGTLAMIRSITEAASPVLATTGVKSATVSTSASHTYTSRLSWSEIGANIKHDRKTLISLRQPGGLRAAENQSSAICPGRLG